MMALRETLQRILTDYRDAIRFKPDYADAHCNLGAVLRQAGKLDEAIAAYQQALAIKPQYAEVHCNLSGVFLDQGKLDKAIAAGRRAITFKPNLADAHNNLGVALTQLGHLSEARAVLEKAVRLAPRNAKYRADVAQISRFVAGDTRLSEMEQLVRDSASLSVDDRIALHFALGKAYDDLGRPAEAFCQWRVGNALNRQQIKYNEAATLGVLDRVRSVFTPELIRAQQNVGHPSSVPVFIVGMPRSATTLVEQILASHPQVFGGGELTHFRSALQGTRKMIGGSASFPELVLGITGECYRDLGARATLPKSIGSPLA
jgi:tetratricopeptide (TPR) repeat protein